MRNRDPVSKLTTAKRRLQILQSEVAARSTLEGFAAQLAELGASISELEVAHEELERQNEELISTREALERQRHRYLHLFEEAPFGYFVTDTHGVIEEANRRAAELVGIEPWRFKGKPLFVYLAEADRKAFHHLLTQACAGKDVNDWEAKLRPRNREPFPVVLTVVRDLDDSQRAVRLRWAVRDVSDTKAAEEALRESEERLRHSQRMEAVGRLAGGIAHSFNNLLAAVTFQCELLCDQLDPADRRRTYVDAIEKASGRAATLARQLLAFGRKQVLQPRLIGLNDVIRSMEPMLRRLIGEHIRLETSLDPAAGSLHVDLGQLEQVLLNLLVNARDAMPHGGGLELATGVLELGEAGDRPPGIRPDLPAGTYISLTVTDTGIGMDESILSRLFEPFFTTKERDKGTGLGLATVHGIIYQSGGDILVASQPGQGTRFTILLPRAGEAAEIQPQAVPQPRPRRGTEVVLLVEDEENIRQPATEMLRSRGYKVLAAPDGKEALSLAASHPGPIHLLITDVVMPGMSGGQLAEEIVAQHTETRVLFISGYSEDAIGHRGVLQAQEHFLQKPFPPGQFLTKVREVLDQTEAFAP